LKDLSFFFVWVESFVSPKFSSRGARPFGRRNFVDILRKSVWELLRFLIDACYVCINLVQCFDPGGKIRDSIHQQT